MADEQPKIDVKREEPQILMPSKKDFRIMILPKVGDMLGNKYKVIYVHDTKMRFTAKADELPTAGYHMVMDGRVFQVEYVNEAKKQFNATFIGFEKVADQKAPEPETANIAKIVE